LKRFLIFGHDDYEASGGWGDFKGSYDTLDEAKQSIPEGIQYNAFCVDSDRE